MSQHPSLRSSDKDRQHRSVLKRYERLKALKEKEKWKEGDSVFGLQKVKVLRFKIKKEKAPKEAEGLEAPVGAEGAQAAAPAAPLGLKTAKAAPLKEALKPSKLKAQSEKEAKK